MSRNYKQPHRGWAVLSTGVSLIILVMVSVWAMTVFNDYLLQRGWQVTASQTSRFRAAVKNYVGRYYDTLLASAGTTSPVVVTPAMLKNTGFLESGFSETTTDGQTFRAAVTRNAINTDQLQGLVITQGGSDLPYKALRNISVDIEGLGGYVWKSANVTGAMESWSVPLVSFGVSTTSGHIAALLPADELGAAREESDRLYRFSVTGKPDLNRMHTSIDMGGNDLNNTDSVNAQTGNYSGDVTAANVTAGNGVTAGGDIRSNNGWLISRGSKGWMNETYGGGFYMSDTDWVRAINNKNIFTGGQVRGGSVRADGRLSAGEYLQLDGQASAGNGCSPNGLVGRDGAGAILSCQNGVWVYVGKNNGSYVNLGYHTSQYNGGNSGQNTLLINVWGGYSTITKGVKDGACSNSWALTAYVDGMIVAQGADNNVEWAKTGYISFPVPAGANFTVQSNPLPNEGCSPGAFNLVGYQ
ncbi:shufflon system plasmid conjugative transfer pilus tip adhesin PilV [Acerihabitans arboris]|uniref:Shufflon system plasmid conjugative transfer pilus tip adhesin PilV n=1 Tax=Acerihabitans arboris TaxID=2691583 RepID=A0A845SHD3_9GAMM|nr:shufflon system plasmid conjugative transfer pilus tip adhesin PilV [Acerihabitans arboris]NDL64280.1 shufflon system plasmid conjugative transfer pilus tip adhesin PilV [Acerihabitans arboris]